MCKFFTIIILGKDINIVLTNALLNSFVIPKDISGAENLSE